MGIQKNLEGAMEQKESSPLPSNAIMDISQELRRVSRANIQCRLTYSGVSSDSLIIGEGMVLNLSKHGCGIQGNQLVEEGMLLTLCIHLLNEEEPLRINEVRVVWVKGMRFGVQSVNFDVNEQERLEDFLKDEFDQEAQIGGPVSFRMNLKA